MDRLGEPESHPGARSAGHCLIFRFLRQLHAAREHEHRHRQHDRGQCGRLQRIHLCRQRVSAARPLQQQQQRIFS